MLGQTHKSGRPLTQTTLPVARTDGLTYSQFVRIRSEKYAELGPDFVRQIVRAFDFMAEAPEEDAIIYLAELNDLSKDLASLDPMWNSFSLKCFISCFDLSPKRTAMSLLEEIKECFEQCAKSLSCEPIS